MPCDNPEHPYHEWPTTGLLTIYSCETFCAFCTDQAGAKKLSEATALRNHVESIHTKRYPGLVVDRPYGYAMRYMGPTVAQLLKQGETGLKRCVTPSHTSTISTDNSSSQGDMLTSPSPSSSSSSAMKSPPASPSSRSSMPTSSVALEASAELEYFKIKDAVNAHYDADDQNREWGWSPKLVRQKFHDQIVSLIHLGGYMGMTAKEVHDVMEQAMDEEFWAMRRFKGEEDEMEEEEHTEVVESDM